MAQRRNQTATFNAEAHFLPVRRHVRNGARIVNALTQLNLDGGGKIRYAWPGNRTAIITDPGTATFVEGGLVDTDYLVTVNGGPYVLLAGAQYLTVADAAWQEPTTLPFCVWAWCRGDTLGGADRTILSKSETAGNQRSMLLAWSNAAGAFRFGISPDGINYTTADSTYTETTGVWYFVGGATVPNLVLGLRVCVGAASDPQLTFDAFGGAAPASAFDGTAPLMLGARMFAGVPASFWIGGIGCAQMRTVPTANLQAYLTRCFHETRWFYQA